VQFRCRISASAVTPSEHPPRHRALSRIASDNEVSPCDTLRGYHGLGRARPGGDLATCRARCERFAPVAFCKPRFTFRGAARPMAVRRPGRAPGSRRVPPPRQESNNYSRVCPPFPFPLPRPTGTVGCRREGHFFPEPCPVSRPASAVRDDMWALRPQAFERIAAASPVCEAARTAPTSPEERVLARGHREECEGGARQPAHQRAGSERPHGPLPDTGALTPQNPHPGTAAHSTVQSVSESLSFTNTRFPDTTG
jgi:hypothetical protein